MLTYDQHILAHYYRFLQYKQSGDKIAYLMMTNQPENAFLLMSSLGGQISGKANVESGYLKKLNQQSTLKVPHLRSLAGLAE